MSDGNLPGAALLDSAAHAARSRMRSTILPAVKPPRSAYAGLFLLSAGALLFQVTLIRIFSAAIWYHVAFLVVSIALFGIGASGVALSLRRPAATAGSVAKRAGKRVAPVASAPPPPA